MEALKSMGLSETRAHSMSRRTARRLPILRRHLLDEAGAPLPTWASSNQARCLIPLTLIGQWFQDSEADKAAVVTLVGKSYEEFERDLTPLLNMGRLTHSEARPAMALRVARRGLASSRSVSHVGRRDTV